MALPQITTPRARRAAAASATPTSPPAFDMAAHRKWFGHVCGANGTHIREMIQRMEA